MNTERLEEFVVLARELNYSKAANALFISQPMLSRHIAELERQLGSSLFSRDTHEVRLTDEGRYLLKWVRPFLENESQVLSSMAEKPIEAASVVRIICSEQVITTPILNFIHSFTDMHPDIRLELLPVIDDEKREQLYACDVMLTSSTFLSPGDNISVTHLLDQDALLAVPPHHHLGDYQEISLKDLEGETIVVPFSGAMYGPYARNAMTASRKCHGQVRRIHAEDAQAGLLKVELGVGVMLIPHHLAHRIYPHTRTVTVTDSDCIFPIYAYHNRSEDNRAAKLFYERICERFCN